MSPLDNSQSQGQAVPTFDVLIVGAGFSGLYLLHRFRKLGISARAIEGGTGVGGTWYWNRYPGARCDVESMQYSYSFSEELQQDWKWSERFSAQPEILRYANHVADGFDLRRDIELETRVTAAHFDEAAGLWRISTDKGARYTARFFIPATGCLSSARTPDFKGRDSFKGRTFHTGHWPHEPVSFTGERVAVIGTGSSAIQAIPVIAEQAAHLTVFQRTPNYSIPSRNEPMPAWYEKSWKDEYARRRAEARTTKNGIVTDFGQKSALEVSEAERRAEFEARWQIGGTTFMQAFKDLVTDAGANHAAAEFVRNKIREIVRDPKVAELLAPKDYPIGTKRICVDSHYYDTYNRPNVHLVDIKSSPIEEITPDGVKVAGDVYEADSIVFATGFDAMTGALAKIDIRGRNNESLVEKWTAGPRTYLGLMSAGFPNMFMITAPGSPSVLSNMMVSIEQHVDWTVDAIHHLQQSRMALIEPTKAAEDEWVVHNNEVAHKTLYPKAASWYMGANIPGKPRIFLPYIGGVGVYRETCTEIAAEGYRGFALTPASALLAG
ncbi:MAG: flavin-containing monooxygenase [Hyphomicrobiaceae bacterium]